MQKLLVFYSLCWLMHPHSLFRCVWPNSKPWWETRWLGNKINLSYPSFSSFEKSKQDIYVEICGWNLLQLFITLWNLPTCSMFTIIWKLCVWVESWILMAVFVAIKTFLWPKSINRFQSWDTEDRTVFCHKCSKPWPLTTLLAANSVSMRERD